MLHYLWTEWDTRIGIKSRIPQHVKETTDQAWNFGLKVITTNSYCKSIYKLYYRHCVSIICRTHNGGSVPTTRPIFPTSRPIFSYNAAFSSAFSTTWPKPPYCYMAAVVCTFSQPCSNKDRVLCVHVRCNLRPWVQTVPSCTANVCKHTAGHCQTL